MTLDPEAARRTTSRLSHRLLALFSGDIASKEGITIDVDAEPVTPEGESQLRFVLPDGTPLRGSLTTHHAGGNVFDIDGRLEEATAHFSLCTVEGDESIDERCSRDLARFFLDEIMRIAGGHALREASLRRSMV